MPMKPFTTLLLFFSLFVFPISSALAWGGQGHRMVAQLAQEQLTPRALAQVNDLLKGEKKPTMAGVASWADELRDTDAALYRKTSKMHYINSGEDGCVYFPATACKDGECVVAALTNYSRVLADPRASREARTEALKFVIHFAGDVYQPLHAGNAKDKGGNDIQLRYNNEGTNLHRLWDSGMFYYEHLSDGEYLNRLRPLQAQLIALDDMHKNSAYWAQQSCRITQAADFYPVTSQLMPEYIQRWRPVAEMQVVLAAQQLADILNRVLR